MKISKLPKMCDQLMKRGIMSHTDALILTLPLKIL